MPQENSRTPQPMPRWLRHRPREVQGLSVRVSLFRARDQQVMLQVDQGSKSCSDFRAGH